MARHSHSLSAPDLLSCVFRPGVYDDQDPGRGDFVTFHFVGRRFQPPPLQSSWPDGGGIPDERE